MSTNKQPFSPTSGKTRSLNINNSFSNQIEKLQPQAVDIEKVVLGAMMIEKNALISVIEILNVEHFYVEIHQYIFEAIKNVFESAHPVDIKTVIYELKKADKLQLVGGEHYIVSLTERVNSAANIITHAHIIIEKSLKRELISIATQIQDEAYQESTDVFTLFDQIEQSIFELLKSNIKRDYHSLKELLKATIENIQKSKSESQDNLTGVPSGFTQLDRLTGGWQSTDLIIVAARPGVGKTAFLLSIMRNAAVNFEVPVAIFSLEMSGVQLIKRMISSEVEIENEKIKKGYLANHEWEQLYNKSNVLENANIFIDDTPAISLFELKVKCRRLVQKHNVKLIAVDYLQLMSDESSKNNNGNREQEIANISRSLKNIAKELDVTFIALSQLSRAVEIRKGKKRPQMSDLRESGSIEQDADMVIFLFREDYYGITEDEEGIPINGKTELIIAKHRNGKTGTVNIKFISKYTKFTDWNDFEDNNTALEDNEYSRNLPNKKQTYPSKANKLKDFDDNFGDSEV